MPKPIIPYNPFYARTPLAKRLRSLFKRWDSLLHWIDGYMKHPKWPDLPFWYGERSNVGWLALAAYDKGLLSLQEPSVGRYKRFRHRGKQRTKRGKGRGDLLIYEGLGKHQKIFDFEAKQSDHNIELSFNKNIRAQLISALKSTQTKPIKEQGNVGVGVVFLPLYFVRKKRNLKDLRKPLNGFLRKVKREELGSVGADFIALHLAPTSIIKAVARANYYPKYPTYDVGIAVLGKIKKL